MNLYRTILASIVLLLWAGVIVQGQLTGAEYTSTVGAMSPVVAVAAGYLFARDAVSAILRRRNGGE